uniref:Uncharacterized protein n=1 Tax=Avena sativa TaxID=4498 RepID=A0ACD5ZTF6_AVESA
MQVSGPIRLQAAQVKLGSKVSISSATDHIVPQDDDDAISVAISESRLLKQKFELAVGKPFTLSWTMAAAMSNEPQLIGRDREKREITQIIASDGEHRQVISVCGVGGLGKTTLVRSVYQSQDLSGLFHKHAWVTVVHPFDSKEFFRSLVLQLHADYSEKEETNVFSMLRGATQKNLAIMGTEELIQESIRLLKGHKYLIVLDDILSMAECNLILPFLPEDKNASRIIVTTREEIVAEHHSREYKLRLLEDQAAVDLFKNKVFKDQAKTFHLNPEMIKEGNLIIKKCGGLPLAIATIGSFLSTRPKIPSEWRNLNDHISAELENNPSFEKIRSYLASSYEGLPYHVKPCFLYMSIFPEGRSVRRGRLVKRWIAEGYSREMRGLTADEVGDKQFSDLINRCMIQSSSTVTSASGNKIDLYQANNLMREISVSKSEEENFVFVLEENCIMHSRDKIRHLVVSSSWSRENRNALESMMDVSHTRSLTVFGEWRSFLLSKKMRLLRVLDLEGTSGLQDHDLVPIGKLRHLKYLSLRGTVGVFNLPGSFGNLCNLETLDIRDTFVTKLPANIVKLERLKYLRAGLIPDDETDSCAEVGEFFRKCRSVMHIRRNGSNDEADNMFVGSFSQLIGVVFDLAVRGLDPYGAKVPKGIGKLTALQTLGVVNVARGNAMPRELKKLTQLRKLGVSGINKKNCKDVCSAIADHGHLLSLSMRAEGEHGLEGCLDDLSTPPNNLQRLKLYGNLVTLPSWIEQLQNLAKLTLRSTRLELDFTLQVLGELPHLAILRLREKSCNVEELSFHFHREAFTSLTVLELENLCYLKSMKFQEAATPKLELLQVHCCQHLDNFGLFGLNTLQSLREVSFQGSYSSTFKNDLQQQLAKNRNKPSLKIQD